MNYFYYESKFVSGASVSDFFTKDPNLKRKKKISEFFFHKESKS